MAARTRYIVTYDITDDAGRNRVFVALQGFGTRMQYSVFLCDLNQREMIALRGRLHAEINHRADSVMVVDVGLAPDRGRYSFESSVADSSYRLLVDPKCCDPASSPVEA